MMSTSSSSDDSSSVKGARTSVAVVGSGAVGGYYGTRLWEAGHDVKFHMRGEHYEQSKANGLNVTVSD
jgi:2-dehydropantoate 2-reductase